MTSYDSNDFPHYAPFPPSMGMYDYCKWLSPLLLAIIVNLCVKWFSHTKVIMSRVNKFTRKKK